MSNARANIVSSVRHILAQNPIYIDTETTGVGPTDEIVEIAVIDSDGHTLIDTLVRPNKSVPIEAYNVHHIGDAELATAPTFGEVWRELYGYIRGATVVTYNAEFDARMIRQSYDIAFGKLTEESHWLWEKFNPKCAMIAYAQFYGEMSYRSGKPQYRWQKLEAAARQCGIDMPNSHRAADDARLAREVMLYMAQG